MYTLPTVLRSSGDATLLRLLRLAEDENEKMGAGEPRPSLETSESVSHESLRGVAALSVCLMTRMMSHPFSCSGSSRNAIFGDSDNGERSEDEEEEEGEEEEGETGMSSLGMAGQAIRLTEGIVEVVYVL